MWRLSHDPARTCRTRLECEIALPPDWIECVIGAESGGLTELGGRPIRSRAAAIGLMQLMPATWETMRVALRL